MNKFVVLGIFVVIFVAGLVVIISNSPMGFDDILRSLKGMRPMVLSLIALPVLALLFLLVAYLRKKSEERRWKKALLNTRAKKQKQGKEAS